MPRVCFYSQPRRKQQKTLHDRDKTNKPNNMTNMPKYHYHHLLLHKIQTQSGTSRLGGGSLPPLSPPLPPPPPPPHLIIWFPPSENGRLDREGTEMRRDVCVHDCVDVFARACVCVFVCVRELALEPLQSSIASQICPLHPYAPSSYPGGCDALRHSYSTLLSSHRRQRWRERLGGHRREQRLADVHAASTAPRLPARLSPGPRPYLQRLLLRLQPLHRPLHDHGQGPQTQPLLQGHGVPRVCPQGQRAVPRGQQLRIQFRQPVTVTCDAVCGCDKSSRDRGQKVC